MRSEVGGGTLLSHVIDRPKLSVTLAAAPAERHKSKRRLSNEESTYASLVKPKVIFGGSILPQACMQSKLRAGSLGMMVTQEQRAHSNTVKMRADLCAAGRFKELRARLALFKPRTAPSPSFNSPPTPSTSLLSSRAEGAVEASSLPQWGLFKRARRSRLESSKSHVGGSTAFANANLPHHAADESVNPTRPYEWTQTLRVFTESDGHISERGTTASTRNATNSKGAGNVCASAREGSACDQGGRPAASYNGEACILLTRHRSEGNAAATLANSHSNGRAVGGTQFCHRVVYEASAAASASLQAKEPQIVELPRILIGLSRKEKEDDFLIFKGTKLPQRPKKRPKVVERALHYCTPGNSLCELLQGRYEVREKKPAKKRARGLKAMESMDCDSD